MKEKVDNKTHLLNVIRSKENEISELNRKLEKAIIIQEMLNSQGHTFWSPVTVKVSGNPNSTIYYRIYDESGILLVEYDLIDVNRRLWPKALTNIKSGKYAKR